MTKNEFIKIGEQIIAQPKGADYDLIPGKVYLCCSYSADIPASFSF